MVLCGQASNSLKPSIGDLPARNRAPSRTALCTPNKHRRMVAYRLSTRKSFRTQITSHSSALPTNCSTPDDHAPRRPPPKHPLASSVSVWRSRAVVACPTGHILTFMPGSCKQVTPAKFHHAKLYNSRKTRSAFDTLFCS